MFKPVLGLILMFVAVVFLFRITCTEVDAHMVRVILYILGGAGIFGLGLWFVGDIFQPTPSSDPTLEDIPDSISTGELCKMFVQCATTAVEEKDELSAIASVLYKRGLSIQANIDVETSPVPQNQLFFTDSLETSVREGSHWKMGRQNDSVN